MADRVDAAMHAVEPVRAKAPLPPAAANPQALELIDRDDAVLPRGEHCKRPIGTVICAFRTHVGA